ncbi:MAG: hypothetical protein ACRDWA_13415 [Acidimicrobiia bacterium]
MSRADRLTVSLDAIGLSFRYLGRTPSGQKVEADQIRLNFQSPDQREFYF